MTGGPLKSGGIQRFKLGLHGARMRVAVVVGYVQREQLRAWTLRINDWIRSEAMTPSAPNESWSTTDELVAFSENPVQGTGRASSQHTRAGAVMSDEILLLHMFIMMQNWA